MDITEHVKEFRALQKTQKIRVADFCRERMLDYYEMVEALKKDKFLSELPEEHVAAAELEVTDLPLEHPDPKSISFIQEVSIQTPSELKVRICGITANDLITVVSKFSSPAVTKLQRTLPSHIHSPRAVNCVMSTHTTTGRTF